MRRCSGKKSVCGFVFEMGFLWKQRAYCAPTFSSFEGSWLSEGGAVQGREGDAVSAEGGIYPSSLRSNAETLSPLSHLPLGLLGELNNSTMPGSDVFFLPKPSNLIKFALPTLVFFPNLSIFTKSWPFYASKAY